MLVQGKFDRFFHGPLAEKDLRWVRESAVRLFSLRSFPHLGVESSDWGDFRSGDSGIVGLEVAVKVLVYHVVARQQQVLDVVVGAKRYYSVGNFGLFCQNVLLFLRLLMNNREVTRACRPVNDLLRFVWVVAPASSRVIEVLLVVLYQEVLEVELSVQVA